MNAVSDLSRVMFSTHPVGLLLWADILIVLFFALMLFAGSRTHK